MLQSGAKVFIHTRFGGLGRGLQGRGISEVMLFLFFVMRADAWFVTEELRI